jgi:hypothetical protein
MFKYNIDDISHEQCWGHLTNAEAKEMIEDQKQMYVLNREEDEYSLQYKLEQKFECYLCEKIPLYQ